MKPIKNMTWLFICPHHRICKTHTFNGFRNNNILCGHHIPHYKRDECSAPECNGNPYSRCITIMEEEYETSK